jgi:tellurite resistance-related uncharacterized protein
MTVTRMRLAKPRPDESDGRQKDRLDRMLDKALELTFPGSDPVAISVSRPAMGKYSPKGNADVSLAPMPIGFEPYRRTAVFTQESIPTALLAAHRTAAGVWAAIHVSEGRLLYRITEPTASETVIGPGGVGVIEPGVAHEVAPLGAVRFYIEFHRLRR